jgi:hypothetical protein
MKRGCYSISPRFLSPSSVSELSAAIEYTAITRDGLLRHAAFKGLQQSRGERPL